MSLKVEVMMRESTQDTPEKDPQHARMRHDPLVIHRPYIIREIGIFVVMWNEGWGYECQPSHTVTTPPQQPLNSPAINKTLLELSLVLFYLWFYAVWKSEAFSSDGGC